MRYRPLGPVPFLAVLGLAACLGSAPSSHDDSPRRPGRTGGATVVDGSQLLTGLGLLDALTGRVSLMQVRHAGGCPEIIMRGRKTFVGSPNPQVYVDGQRAGDTCILEQLQTANVERVEVYPMGVTFRPGYRASPNGLILVFSRKAPS